MLLIQFLIGMRADQLNLIRIAAQQFDKQGRNHVIQKSPAIGIVQENFLIHIQKKVPDLYIISSPEQKTADRIFAVEAVDKKIGNDVAVSYDIKKVVPKGIFADMNIQDDAVVKYLDGLFYIRRKKKYISLFHGYIQIAHLMAALSGQNIKHSKKVWLCQKTGV